MNKVRQGSSVIRILVAAVFGLALAGFVFVGCAARADDESAEGQGSAPEAPLPSVPAAPDEGGGYRAVVYDRISEMFLAAGTGGRLDAISVEDEAVTTLEVPGDEDLLCIYADDNIVLTGGAGGAIFYSEGETFHRADTGVTSTILDIAAFSGRYFAGGEGGLLLSSNTGKAWRSQRFDGAGDIIGIAALQGNLQGSIMAITAGSVFYVSEDGVNWSFQNFNEYYDEYYEPLVFRGIEAFDNMFFVYGYFEGSPDAPFLMRSFDGTVWDFVPITEITLDTVERYAGNEDMPEIHINAIATDTAQVLAALDGGYVMTLDNCEECHKVTDISDVDLHGIAFGGGVFLAAGDGFKFDTITVTPRSEFEISAETAAEYIAEGAIVIDVRSPEESASGKIPGSLNIPLDEIHDRLYDEVPDTHARLIFYCDDGERAQIALEIAVGKGYWFVYNLGGIGDWPYEVG